jgi:LAO/AO transport system kinase
VVNKADRPGVESTEKALKTMLELAHPTERVFQHHGVSMKVEAPKQKPTTAMWIPPIQRTVSTEGGGIPELADAIARHVAHLRLSGDWVLRERTRLEVELEALIREGLMNRFREEMKAEAYENMLESVIQRKVSPWEAAAVLLNGRQS